MRKRFFLQSSLVLTFLALACLACVAPTAATQPVKRSPERTEPLVLPDPQALPEQEVLPGETPTRPERTLPEGAVPFETVESTPIVGEVPDALLDAIIADLVAQREVDPQAIDVIQAEAVVWKDGSLGCAQPGQVYTQAPVEGYQVILGVGSQTYDYRAANSGYFFLCGNPLRR